MGYKTDFTQNMRDPDFITSAEITEDEQSDDQYSAYENITSDEEAAVQAVNKLIGRDI